MKKLLPLILIIISCVVDAEVVRCNFFYDDGSPASDYTISIPNHNHIPGGYAINLVPILPNILTEEKLISLSQHKLATVIGEREYKGITNSKPVIWQELYGLIMSRIE